MTKKQEVLLKNVWQQNLCAGCGACAAVCPKEIIDLSYLEFEGFYKANIVSDQVVKCINCGLCNKVCPIVISDTDTSQNKVSLKNMHELLEWLTGPYEHVYTGYTINNNLRYECSSGGIATSILLYLFETCQIEGVILPVPDPNNHTMHRSVLVTDQEEVLRRKGTVYCQVDYTDVWECIEKTQGRVAVMGQPCHLKALNLFLAARKIDPSKIFKIGLFCGGITSHKVLNFLCRRQKIKPENVLNLRYRSGGWPGRKMVATVADLNTTREIVLFDRDKSRIQSLLYNFCFSGAFFPNSCLVCNDQTAEHADISLGDAWLPRLTLSDSSGVSIAISRSREGQQVLEDMMNSGVVQLNETDADDILYSQGNCLVGRKTGLWGRHINAEAVPEPGIKICNELIPQFMPDKRILAERRFFRWLVRHFPPEFSFFLYAFYYLSIGITFKIAIKIRSIVLKGFHR